MAYISPLNQSRIDQATGQTRLAQTLGMQAMAPQQGVASPLAALGKVLTSYFAKQGMDKAGAQRNEILRGQQDSNRMGLSDALSAYRGDTPYQMPQEQMFPGEQPIQGLKNMGSERNTGALIESLMGSQNPQMQALGLQQALAQPKDRPGFSLEPGETRYDSTGKPIVTNEAPPVDPNAPWASINDPKKRDDAKMREAARATSTLEKMREASDNAEKMNRDLDRFLYLNKNTPTGPGYKVPGAKTIGGAFSDSVQEMTAISDRLTPGMRQGLPGAASERDTAMFRSGTVSPEKAYEANKNVAEGLEIANQNLMDRADFFDAYYNENGYLKGADQMWKQYLEANPIFDPQADPGSYAINQTRQAWEQWVANQQASPGSSQDIGGSQEEKPISEMTDEELQAIINGG